jgi:transcription antitermination factor NusA-like protein
LQFLQVLVGGMVETSICETCLSSDSLCNECQNKLEKGKITEKDIEVSKFLMILSDKVKSLSDIKIIKIIDSECLIIVSKIGDAAKLVGKNGFVVKALAKEFKKPIRILEEAETMQKFVENLISPISIQGVNTLYTPEGEVFKFRIPFNHKGRLNVTPESFTDIMSDIYNCKAELIFEQ